MRTPTLVQMGSCSGKYANRALKILEMSPVILRRGQLLTSSCVSPASKSRQMTSQMAALRDELANTHELLQEREQEVRRLMSAQQHVPVQLHQDARAEVRTSGEF